MFDERPIGFFDSGVGGLTVLREVMRRLPDESTIYLGDNARAPYGPRSDDEVNRFSAECLDQLAARDVKAIVVACNTSSAIALNDLRLRYAAADHGRRPAGRHGGGSRHPHRRVGVIATAATVRSHAYFQAIKDEDPFLRVTSSLRRTSCRWSRRAARRARSSKKSLAARCAHSMPPPERPIDTLLLGCTHYPLLAPVIERQLGGRVAIIDSASATASAPWLICSTSRHSRLGRCQTSPRSTDNGRRGPVQGHRRTPLWPDVPDRRIGRSGHRRREQGETTMTATAPSPARPDQAPWRDQRTLGLALVIGAAGLAVASRFLARRAHNAAADGLVDWRRAEQVAISRLRRAAGALPQSELTAAEPAYAAAMATVVPLLENQLELPLARRRRALCGGRPGRLGTRQPGHLPEPHRPAGGADADALQLGLCVAASPA